MCSFSPFHYANATLDSGHTTDYNVTSISYVSVRIPNAKALQSVTLPLDSTYINFFSVTLLPALTSGGPSQTADVQLSVQNVRSTTKWIGGADGSSADKVQQIEVTLNNLAPLNASTSSWLTATYNVSLVSDDIETVVPGIVKRLRSNDQVVVPVGVRNRVGVKSGTSAKVQVVLSSAGENQAERDVKLEDANDWDVVAGIPEWTNGDASLRTHEAPEWVSIYVPHSNPPQKRNADVSPPHSLV